MVQGLIGGLGGSGIEKNRNGLDGTRVEKGDGRSLAGIGARLGLPQENGQGEDVEEA